MHAEPSWNLIDEKRATIFINTDFPSIKRFIEKGDYENKQFDLLLKEIALTELSIAITTILQRDGYYGDDNLTALVDLRNRINDFSRFPRGGFRGRPVFHRQPNLKTFESGQDRAPTFRQCRTT